MPYLEISNPWGIADEELGASLTWSITLIKSSKDVLWWNKIIIDFWMHQWSKNADLLNKEIPKELIDADFLVITHAHMDHIWRIPQLVKAWFRWKIVMTAITKDIALLMWQDYINLTQKQIEELEEWNKKKWQRFREMFKFIKSYDKLKTNNLSKKEKASLTKYIKQYWNHQEEIDALYEAYQKKLKHNNVHDENDIESVLNSNIPELLYDINDIYDTLGLIKTLEVWEEISLDSRIVITKSDSDVIERIPEIIENGYDKSIYVLPWLKQHVINSLYSDYNTIIEDNKKNKLIRDEYNEYKKFINKYNKVKNKGELSIPKWYTADSYYNYCLEKIELNEFFILKSSLEEAFKYKEIVDNSIRFNPIKNVTKEELDDELENLAKKIDLILNEEINWIKFKDLDIFLRQNKRNLKDLNYYNIVSNFVEKNNINSLDDFLKIANAGSELNWFLSKSKKHSRKSKLSFIYNNYIFYRNNKEYILALYNNSDFNDKEKELKKLYQDLSSLKTKIKLYQDYEDFKTLEWFYNKKIKILEEYNIRNKWDILKVLEEKYANKKLKYTKKQIEKYVSRLEIILEKDNEKIVESLKLRFLKAGHIEWSVMASFSYVIKEIKSKVNWILNYWNEVFSWHKEIKKSFRNLLFSWDLWKLTQANLSWRPDIPQFKYDYVQLESTYADREHPDKQKEFLRLLKILSRPWKKLIAAFSLQRTQEILTELLNNKLENKENIEKLRKLYKTKEKFSREYRKLLKKNEDLTTEEQNRKTELFWFLSWLEEELQNIQKGIFTWFIIQDSPLAEKITKEFIKHYPDTYKILDPLFQKSIFWKEQIRTLWPWEYKNLYTKRRITDAEIIISSWWMMQWWAIINHVKELISDKNATIILSWYVAEWTLGRQLLDIEKQLIWAWKWEKFIEIDWEKYEVKCKIESIWGYSSHMWQWDLVNFWWKIIDYSKNAILSLTHWDETRGILKDLISWVNSKLNVIIPKLWNKLKLKL